MRIRINWERPGRKVRDAPSSIFLYADDGNTNDTNNIIGEIEFTESRTRGFEVVIYSYSKTLAVGAAPYTE